MVSFHGSSVRRMKRQQTQGIRQVRRDRKHQPVAGVEIQDGAARNRKQAGGHVPHIPIAHKQLHQEQIPAQGHDPAAHVKACQATPPVRTVGTGPFGPGPFLVPQEVVEDGHPHRHPRCSQVVHTQSPGKDSQDGQLHDHAHPPHGIKEDPAAQNAGGRPGSGRLRSLPGTVAVH